jgi:hypothetical protein
MFAASVIAIFLIPVTFSVVERLTLRAKQLAGAKTPSVSAEGEPV